MLSDIEGHAQLINVNYSAAKILLSDDTQMLLAITSNGQLLSQKIQEKNGRLSLSSPQTLYNNISVDDDSLIQMKTPKGDLVFVLCRDGVNRLIKYVSSSNPAVSGNLCTLDPTINWSLASTFDSSGTLAVAGQPDGNPNGAWRIDLLRVPKELTIKDELGNPKPAEVRTVSHYLPTKIKPKQIEMLSADQLFILDQADQLHYWDLHRPVPSQLNHQQWSSHSDFGIMPGVNGWICAVAANHDLRIWRVRQAGSFSPYQGKGDGLQITGINNSQMLKSTSDGRYIVGAATGFLYAWEFPRYYSDEL